MLLPHDKQASHELCEELNVTGMHVGCSTWYSHGMPFAACRLCGVTGAHESHSDLQRMTITLLRHPAHHEFKAMMQVDAECAESSKDIGQSQGRS